MTFEEFLEEWRGAGDSISAHTSGSTGIPKTIELKKEFVCRSGRRTNSFFRIGPESRLHSCVAADFIGGKMMAVRSELAGCRLTWETPSNRPLAGVTMGERIDLLAVVPSQMLYILENRERLPALGAIIIGGSAIHPALRERIIESGLNAYETYGMTETASHIALRKITRGERWFVPLEGIRVGLDSRGCLDIEFESGERIATNDIAEVNADGGFRILGRFDNVIITGGKKVNPEDVERRIAALVEGDFIIVSRADEKWGERIVLRIAGMRREEEEILRRLRDVLEAYEMPKEIEWVEQLPTTANGKVIRR